MTKKLEGFFNKNKMITLCINAKLAVENSIKE